MEQELMDAMEKLHAEFIAEYYNRISPSEKLVLMIAMRKASIVTMQVIMSKEKVKI